MILRKFYSIPERFDVTFKKEGINIVCADVTEKSGDKDTRNGLGKSTFFHLLDFCLLGELKEKIKLSAKFQEYSFCLEFQLMNSDYYKIKRSVKTPEVVHIAKNSDDFIEKDMTSAIALLREIMWGLPPKEDNPLTFRTLMNCIKRDENIGFSKEFLHFGHWQKYMVDSANLYLIGLNYFFPLEKFTLINEKKEVNKIIFGLTKDLERKEVGTKASLKAEKLIVDENIKMRKKQLAEFKVLEEYEELEAQSNAITKSIKNIQNTIFINSQKLNEYKASLSKDVATDFSEVKMFYESVKVNLGDKLTKKYDEIINFHNKLIESRNNYLASEINEIERNQNILKQKFKELDEKRAEIMELLNTHGALAEYSLLQQNLDKDKEKSSSIQYFIKVREEIDGYKSNSKEITKKLESNNEASEKMMNENEGLINNIVLIFQEIYKSLVDITGILSIGLKEGKRKADDNIFTFDITGERGDSPGIIRTKIFAYDTSILLHNISQKRIFPQFIIHDGIFNGVDSRIKKNALTYVQNKSSQETFQYFVAINSDELPSEFNNKNNVVLKLTDTNNRNLMGFDF